MNQQQTSHKGQAALRERLGTGVVFFLLKYGPTFLHLRTLCNLTGPMTHNF